MHQILTFVDPQTGQTRLIVGDDQGVFTGVDASDGTLDTAIGNSPASATAFIFSGGSGSGASSGSVAEIQVVSGGSGYTTAPTVTLIGGGATVPATAVAQVTDGIVTAILLTGSVTSAEVFNSGSGYSSTSPPGVTLSGGGGTGATATAVVNAFGQVIGVTITDEGSGYTSAPTITIAAPTSGTTATATAIFTATSGGSGYLYAPTVIISPPPNYVPVVTYSRNGNLQIAQLLSGAAEPSTAAASATGALFYGNGLGVGGEGSDPQVLSDGNTQAVGTTSNMSDGELRSARGRPQRDRHRHRSAGSGDRLSVRLARLLRLEHQLLPGQRRRRSVHPRDQRPDPGGQ